MGSMSIVHWAVVIVVIVILFGKNKISGLMQDIGGGLKAFRKGMEEAAEPVDLPKIERRHDLG